MNPLLKIAFYVTMIINGLVSLFYFGGTIITHFFPPDSYIKQDDEWWGLVVGAISLALLWYARKLAIDDHQISLGFVVLLVAYLIYPISLILMLIFPDHLNWK